MPTNAPSRYAVIGHPVAHSQSPFIHAAFADQTGQAIDYSRIDCGAQGFRAAVQAFAASGAAGCNITVPFKFEALAAARRASERAQLAGAANVLVFDSDGWLADNSDGVGLRRDIEQGAAQAIAGLRVLLVGAGGAAAGVLGPLLEAGPAEVVLVNRTAERARVLAQRHAGLAAKTGTRLAAADIERPGSSFDLVINATASSLQGAAVPIPAASLGPGALAVDLMYGQAARPFLDWAERHGARGRDGLGMLVEQAAEAFWLWRGVRPHTAPVMDALRQRLAAAA